LGKSYRIVTILALQQIYASCSITLIAAFGLIQNTDSAKNTAVISIWPPTAGTPAEFDINLKQKAQVP